MPAYCRIVHSRPRYIVGYGAARERERAGLPELRARVEVRIGLVDGLQLDPESVRGAVVGHRSSLPLVARADPT